MLVGGGMEDDVRRMRLEHRSQPVQVFHVTDQAHQVHLRVALAQFLLDLVEGEFGQQQSFVEVESFVFE